MSEHPDGAGVPFPDSANNSAYDFYREHQNNFSVDETQEIPNPGPPDFSSSPNETQNLHFANAAENIRQQFPAGVAPRQQAPGTGPRMANVWIPNIRLPPPVGMPPPGQQAQGVGPGLQQAPPQQVALHANPATMEDLARALGKVHLSQAQIGRAHV